MNLDHLKTITEAELLAFLDATEPRLGDAFEAISGENLSMREELDARQSRGWQAAALTYFRIKGVSPYWEQRSREEGAQFVFREAFDRLGHVDSPKARAMGLAALIATVTNALESFTFVPNLPRPVAAAGFEETKPSEVPFDVLVLGYSSDHGFEVRVQADPETDNIECSALTMNPELRDRTLRVDIQVGERKAFSGEIIFGEETLVEGSLYLCGRFALGLKDVVKPVLETNRWTVRLELLESTR
jgi:hypothetical protein